MNSVVELLRQIKQRPAMYIGRSSILCLKAFIDGWYLRSPNEVIDANVMELFQDWIEKKYDEKSSRSWCDILLYNSQDENKALELFFKEFDNCLESNFKI